MLTNKERINSLAQSKPEVNVKKSKHTSHVSISPEKEVRNG